MTNFLYQTVSLLAKPEWNIEKSKSIIVKISNIFIDTVLCVEYMVQICNMIILWLLGI